MNKYLSIAKNEVQRQMTFRFNIWCYRIGNIAEIASQLIVWAVIFKSIDIFQGYTYEEMITYTIIGWLFVFVTGNYGLENVVEDDIYLGKLTEFLVKPISYLRQIFYLSIGRMGLALLTGLFIQVALIILYRNILVFDISFLNVIILLAMLLASLIMKIFISIIIGLITFWTQRIVGIDYSLNVIMKFLSGVYFPLALLPSFALTICKFLPFAYTIYFPTQFYLGKISTIQGLFVLAIEIIWIFIFYAIIKLIWKKGTRKYESVGI